MKNPDGIGIVGNPKCGDIMRIYIKVGKNGKAEKMIKDIRFETLGCGAAIATSSVTTEMAKGKTFADALKIDKQSVADELGGLPPMKMHCSNLAADALKKAIENFNSKKNKAGDEK